MTSTDRTRLSRIWRKASTTMSPERTSIGATLLGQSVFDCVHRVFSRGPCPSPPNLAHYAAINRGARLVRGLFCGDCSGSVMALSAGSRFDG